MKVNEWRPKITDTEGCAKPTYIHDRYGLYSMQIGDEHFVIGVDRNHVSPYCTYMKKKGRGVFTVHKSNKDGKHGVLIRRIK